jgi:hypothetical protein
MGDAKKDARRKMNVEKMLECSICLQPFTKPQILFPCAHTFCEQCVLGSMETESALRVGEMTCPECRTRVDEFKPNLIVAGLIENCATTEDFPVIEAENIAPMGGAAQHLGNEKKRKEVVSLEATHLETAAARLRQAGKCQMHPVILRKKRQASEPAVTVDETRCVRYVCSVVFKSSRPWPDNLKGSGTSRGYRLLLLLWSSLAGVQASLVKLLHAMALGGRVTWVARCAFCRFRVGEGRTCCLG